jgi:hypothetical protein
LIGEDELSFAYGAFEEMGDLPRISDNRLNLPDENLDMAFPALLFEEELHDPATLSLVEGLDGWLVQGYVYERKVIFFGLVLTKACHWRVSP